MARERTENTATESTEAAAPAKAAKESKTAAQVAAGGTAGGDGRSIVLKLPDGTSIKRTDYIRKRWSEDRVSRGEITKEVNALTAATFGDDAKAVPYQVIFQATKGVEGGPKKEAAAPKSE